MDHEHEATSGGGRGPDLDRRATIAKLGAGAAAAWIAPSIISAPAASAATLSPECGPCNQNLVINGDAETGVIAPWTSVPDDGGATIAPVLWAAIADDFVAPPSAGQYAFFTTLSTSTVQGPLLQQRIGVAGCVGGLFSFTGRFGAMLSNPLAGTATVTLRTQFLDGSDNPIVLSGISVHTAASVNDPATTTAISENFVVPVGAATAVVGMLFSVTLDPQQQATAAAVFDQISLELICPL